MCLYRKHHIFHRFRYAHTYIYAYNMWLKSAWLQYFMLTYCASFRQNIHHTHIYTLNNRNSHLSLIFSAQLETEYPTVLVHLHTHLIIITCPQQKLRWTTYLLGYSILLNIYIQIWGKLDFVNVIFRNILSCFESMN